MRAVTMGAVLFAVGSCGARTHPWRTPVAAGLLATQAALGIAQAVRGQGEARPDRPGACPSIPKPPVVGGCLLRGPHRHEARERCTYFCVDHCSYHVGEEGQAPPKTPAPRSRPAPGVPELSEPVPTP